MRVGEKIMKFKVGDKVITKENKIYVIEKIS